MNNLSGVDAIIKDFLEELKAIVIAYLDLNNRNATGNFKKSLKVTNVANIYFLKGAYYSPFIDAGRGQTRSGVTASQPTLYAQILQWCRAKGIDEKYAWPITKKIHKEGTDLFKSGGSGTFEGLLSKDRVNQLNKELGSFYRSKTVANFIKR